MPTNGDADGRVGDALRSIGHQARAVNLGRAAQLAEAMEAAEAGRLAEGRRISVIDHAHQLVGSAGTFGFPVASRLAASLEGFFAAGTFNDPATMANAREQLRQLFTVLSVEPTDPPDEP